jgi:glycosyltransferase involved in cell wall biosynthesis
MVGSPGDRDAVGGEATTSATAAPTRPNPRAVILVGGPAKPYSRALRIARTLVDAGFRVEIAAIAADGLPDREMEGPITIRRYRPSGPYAGMAATQAGSSSAPQPTARRPLPARVVAMLRRWLFWPHTVRGWWATLKRELEPADLYHACGSLTVAAALAARERDRRAGRSSRVIYDAIDDVVNGNNVIGMPGLVRAVIRRRERGWARAADARTTVNEVLAAALASSWGMVTPPTIVPNWPDPATAQIGRPDLIRQATGLSADTRIVIFQGRLGSHRGLDEAAEAILEVPDAVLCLMGFGPGFAASRARDTDPRYAGRHLTLPAVHPDEILAWTASADVALVAIPPVSENQRAATPTKFWDALVVGTPLVVGPGLPLMDRIVEADDLGVVADSLRPSDLAAAIRRLLDVAPDEATERRRRIATVARERYSWPLAAALYRALVASVLGNPDRRPE